MAELKSLIAELEQASEAQQEPLLLETMKLAYGRGWITEEVFERMQQWIALGAYESAALTLVERGWIWGIESSFTNDGDAWVTTRLINSFEDVDEGAEFTEYKAVAETPALAFCIAALKARETA